MASKKRPAGAVGKGGVNAAPRADDHTVRVAAEQLELVPIDDLVPYANNAKIHDKKQIAQLRASLREFGFVTPVLIDFDNNIIAGHGRVEAARAEGMTEVPCVLVSNLTEAQRKAYILADNRLSETSFWDTEALKIELEGLEALQFDVGIIGFDIDAIKSFGLEQVDVDDADPIQQESDDAKTFDHVLIFDKQKIVLTDDEAKDFQDRLNCYIDRCGVSFGFVRELLNGQMG